MKQKLTPLAQLKSIVESLPKLEGARDYTRGHNDCRKLFNDEIDKLFQEEKQMVIDARATAPLLHRIDEQSYLDEAKKYFNDNFKQ
jgi:hypothetical protein